jgi:hypothetical protein
VSWDEQARKQWKDYRSRMSTPQEALDSIRAWAERNPMTVSTTFDNEAGPDFSRIFEEAPAIEGTPADTARLKDYAMRLRDLMARRDTAALMREFRPTFTDHETGTPASDDRIRKIIGQNWFSRDWRLDFERRTVRVRRWSEGRVWELYRKASGDPLFVSGTKQKTGLLDVYVAELDGELRVVR